MVKKGPWTVTEDSVLAEYVRKHGEGNWNVVEKNSGLERCGKSCRLRWFNHLRPNLKRGAFTPEEERIIVYLHSQFGNKWARIALRLPGRTDNEIKNYWNTRSKRLERAGLPLYPDGIVPKHNQVGNHNKNGTTLSSSSNRTHFSKPDGRGVSSVASSSSKPLYSNFKLSPQLSMGPFSYSKPINPRPYFSNSNFQNNDYLPKNGSGSNNPFSSTPYISPFSPSPSTMFNPSLETQFSPTYPFQLKPTNFNINPNPSQYSVANTEGELSSIQLPMGTTPISYESSSSNGANLKETSFAYDPDPFCFSPLSSDNGLLEDVWAACSTLVHYENMNTEISTHKGKEICMSGSDSGSSSLHTSTRKKVRDAFEEMAITFDDDLSSLLEDFPLNVPSPEWYNAIYGNSSNENPKI